MLLKMEQNEFYLVKQASEISKITLSVIVYAPCLNKTPVKTNKKQMNSSADVFFVAGNATYKSPCWSRLRQPE